MPQLIHFQADPGVSFTEHRVTQPDGTVVDSTTNIGAASGNPAVFTATYADALPPGSYVYYAIGSDGRGAYGTLVVNGDGTAHSDDIVAAMKADAQLGTASGGMVANAATAAAEIAKVPRAASALTAGGASRWTNVGTATNRDDVTIGVPPE